MMLKWVNLGTLKWSQDFHTSHKQQTCPNRQPVGQKNSSGTPGKATGFLSRVGGLVSPFLVSCEFC